MKLTVPALVPPASRASAAQEQRQRHEAETLELLKEIDELLADLSRATTAITHVRRPLRRAS